MEKALWRNTMAAEIPVAHFNTKRQHDTAGIRVDVRSQFQSQSYLNSQPFRIIGMQIWGVCVGGVLFVIIIFKRLIQDIFVQLLTYLQ